MHYRLYALHQGSGKIMSAQDIMAADDGDAIRTGRETFPGGAFELWCRTRRVCTEMGDRSNATG